MGYKDPHWIMDELDDWTGRRGAIPWPEALQAPSISCDICGSAEPLPCCADLVSSMCDERRHCHRMAEEEYRLDIQPLSGESGVIPLRPQDDQLFVEQSHRGSTVDRPAQCAKALACLALET